MQAMSLERYKLYMNLNMYRLWNAGNEYVDVTCFPN